MGEVFIPALMLTLLALGSLVLMGTFLGALATMFHWIHGAK